MFNDTSLPKFFKNFKILNLFYRFCPKYTGQIRVGRTRMESSVFGLQSLESNPESGPDPIVIHSFELFDDACRK